MEKTEEKIAKLLQNVQLECSVCLSDIPKEMMRKGSNGKIYTNITVGMRKDPDQWGRTLKVFMTQTKEIRESGATKVYIGGGKLFIFNNGDQPITEKDLEDLPF